MIKRITTLGAAIAAGCLLTVPAHAGCGVSDAMLNGALAHTHGLSAQVHGTSGPSGALKTMMQGLHEQGESFSGRDQAIVGMWQFTFTSLGNQMLGIPDGATLDSGFQTWHSDGTELTNSMRAPPTSNFCMGVWGFKGSYGYRLNHFALSWDPTGTVFVGPANIREHLHVGTGGNSISGTVTIDQYGSDGVTLLLHLEGTVSGSRITP